MFRLSVPTKVIISSGGFLALLTLSSLLIMSNTVNTSDINDHVDNLHSISSNRTAGSIESTGPQLIMKDSKVTARVQSEEPRRRSGRLYQQANQPIESYAAAYAATNVADQALSSHHQVSQPNGVDQTVPNQADSSAYASFGETVPHNSASYINQPSSLAGYYPAASNNHIMHHHYKSGQSSSPLPYGYPTNAYERGPSYYDRGAHQTAASSPFWSASSFNSGGGLMSSASHALSHWTNGFSISEIICGLVALTIGAIILGAPFFLIYLALMGNFSGSGTLSLTNPTSASGATGGATQANGRRKRLAVFDKMEMDEHASRHPGLAAMADSIVRELSPFVDLGQVSKTFKHLVRSIEEYSHTKDGQTKRAKQKSS